MASGRFCGNCGAAIDPRTRYCGHCGARIGATVPVGQQAPQGQPSLGMTPAAPAAAPVHASMPPVTGTVPVMSAGVAPAGGLSSSTVGRGRYVIEHLLGRGGMSAVYAARDLHISGRLVAIKEMVDQFADPQERLEAERDFAREADMLATLRHPAIPAIIDRFSENSRHLLVMEYIAGENLESTLAARGGPFTEEQVRVWALELCSVLAYLHSQQPPVVFRDLKPGNIIIQADGRVRLIDFGIARLFKPQQKADTTALGTSGYASPEHYTGQTDARSDVYSLGATMHHLLTARDPSKFPPFQFPSVRDLNPAVSSELATVIERAVRTDREKRFASAQELREALERKRKKSSKAAAPAPATATRSPAPAPSTPATAAPTPAQAPPASPVTRPPGLVTPAPAPPSSAAPRQVPPATVAPPALPAIRSPAPPPAARPVLVLESFLSGRRIDYGAVAARVAALTGGSTAALLQVVQRGLPVTLPLPAAGAVSGVQALAALGVKARVVMPGAVPVLLSADLRRRLDTTHQLVVRDVIVGPARTCRCRRCGHVWQTLKAAGEPVPLRCPSCRSLEWGRWRIFKCAWCGHEFDSADVTTKRTDRLYPACPCCGLVNWETGRPPARTGWLDRLLAALAGTA